MGSWRRRRVGGWVGLHTHTHHRQTDWTLFTDGQGQWRGLVAWQRLPQHLAELPPPSHPSLLLPNLLTACLLHAFLLPSALHLPFSLPPPSLPTSATSSYSLQLLPTLFCPHTHLVAFSLLLPPMHTFALPFCMQLPHTCLDTLPTMPLPPTQNFLPTYLGFSVCVCLPLASIAWLAETWYV